MCQAPLPAEPSYQPKVLVIFHDGNSPLAMQKSPLMHLSVRYSCSLGGPHRFSLWAQCAPHMLDWVTD